MSIIEAVWEPVTESAEDEQAEVNGDKGVGEEAA